jgi:hypothetical protein
MRTIRCTRNVGIRGTSFALGDVLDVPDQEARNLVVMGKAVYVDPPPVVSGPLTTVTAAALVHGAAPAEEASVHAEEE